MTNTNCLENIVCPHCGHTDSFIMHIAPFGRTLKYQGLYQGPDRCAVASYVPRLITCASS